MKELKKASQYRTFGPNYDRNIDMAAIDVERHIKLGGKVDDRIGKVILNTLTIRLANKR